MRPLPEQTILITGATDGLGRALAGELAAAGAAVLIHGRDEQRIAATLSAIADETAGARLSPYRADFSSLADVRSLARRVADEHDRLDVLVNNAGIGTSLPGDGRRLESADGHELRFQVNYLAGFLLTRLLLGLLVRSAPARIVNVSSAGQMPIDFDDVMLTRDYRGTRAYCQSKLAQVMFTFDLAEELDPENVTANCLHPGTYMPTKMVLAAGVSPATPLERGVEATMRLIAGEDLDGVSGRYFNGQRDARADAQAYDADARRTLRELSVELTGVSAAAR